MFNFLVKVLMVSYIVVGSIGTVMIGSEVIDSFKPPKATHVSQTFTLSKDIYGSLARYQPLIQALTTAHEGDTITIVLDHNDGGYVANEYMVLEAVNQSKATVITRIKGWASSAAFSIWVGGDRVVIPKISEIGTVGVAHLSSPRTAHSIERDIRYSQFYKRFMTVNEWNRMVAGEDVYMDGKRMCDSARDSVIEDTAKYCVVKTERHFDFNLYPMTTLEGLIKK